MNTKISSTNQSTAATPERYTTGSVLAHDGVTLGYRQFGQGPGLVVLHGAASSGYNHVELAEALAHAFTVYVPDRRGRGLSGPYSADYRIQQDVADVDALLSATGARQVFGVSSGGIICLEAALNLPAIRKVAIYEPPLSLTRSEAAAILARYDWQMARGKVAAALITGMKGAQMGPAFLNIMPGWLIAPLVNMVMKGEEKNGSGGYVSMRAIAPTLHYDFALVVEMSEKMERFRALQTEVLLLGGSKSPAYLKAALDTLEQVLPHVTRQEFPGLDHAASWNYDKQRNPGGKPEIVAQALRRFFAESDTSSTS